MAKEVAPTASFRMHMIIPVSKNAITPIKPPINWFKTLMVIPLNVSESVKGNSSGIGNSIFFFSTEEIIRQIMATTPINKVTVILLKLFMINEIALLSQIRI